MPNNKKKSRGKGKARAQESAPIVPLVEEAGQESIFNALNEAAEIDFTNAFNKNRSVLAGFSKCQSKAELHCVRDGFSLGMARELGLVEYEPVKKAIVEDFQVAAADGTAGGFEQMILSARKAEGWNNMIARLMQHAQGVGSDLAGIWMGLENGRMEWLQAIEATYKLKGSLREALKKDGGTEGDVTDGKMVWMYAMGTSLPACKEVAKKWAIAAAINTPDQPLLGYKADLWDPRKEEWAALDLGVQAAAERAGTSLDEAWAM